MRWVVVATVIMATLIASSAQAQSLYGRRLQSNDGSMILPVATRLLCSDSADHTRRGSIPSWDLCVPKDTPIFAAAPGVVILANCGNQGGYGCWVKLDHGGGITTAYAHMVQGSIMVQPGQRVDVNTVLGQVGWTGKTSFGPHVHFVIYRNGAHVDPAKVFNRSAMQYCKLCASPAGNATPLGVAGQTQQQVQRHPTILDRIPGAVVILGAEQTATLVTLIFVAICVFWWLGGLYVRVGIVSGAVGMMVALMVVWLIMPAPVTATTASTMPAQFAAAYQLTRGQEGRGCDTYIVRTLNGVTQWTYDRYRKEQGRPTADVCGNLTEQETQDIYFRYYWQPIGADALSQPAAIQAFDHAINAGVGEGKRIIAACGNDAACMYQQRVNFYQSTATCRTKSTVCAAWLRRVNSIYNKVKVQ